MSNDNTTEDDRRCTIEECSGRLHCRGLCQNHYRQLRRRERGLQKPGPKTTREIVPTTRANVRMVLGGQCRNGHDLNEENVFYESRGYMRCRVCLSNHRRVRAGLPEVVNVRRRGTGFCHRGHPLEGKTCRTCRRDRDIEQKYGLTVEAFDALLLAQSGACAICSTVFETIDKRHLHVDHDHNTGAVRGLLCHGCNTALGLFGDDAGTTQRATDYLRSFQPS